MNFIKLTEDKLSIEAINDLVADESCGAISLFVGTTRDNFGDKKVKNLEYEAYQPMAIKVMKQICNDLREKFTDIKKIAIYHRLGMVPVKEASVIIAISSPHRETSLDAVHIAIDELKKSVPIWKKEQYDNAESAWKENKECPGEPKRLKISKLNFNACPIDSMATSGLVQISANENEIKRRIGCFVEKKREEIDMNNILDFTNNKNPNIPIDDLPDCDNFSCARVNSIVLKKKDSKGHLKVHRVKNEYGPQTKPDYLHALDKLMKNEMSESQTKIKQEPIDCSHDDVSNSATGPNRIPFGLKERLENTEKFLEIKAPNMKNIYERIKVIEDKILFLESISPEYRHFLVHNPIELQIIKKKTYSIEDIDDLISTVKNV